MLKKISFLVLIIALFSVFALFASAKCADGCVYTVSPWCDVCGEQIEGECTGSHLFESGYCVICGAFDESTGDEWCSVIQGYHSIVNGVCEHCGYTSCYHNDLGGLHIVEGSTCIKQGSGYRVCLGCGVSIDEVLPYADHDFVSGVCIACNYTCPHSNYGAWSADSVSSSCNNAGKRERACLDCGFIDREAVTPGPHTWVNGWCTVCGAGSEQNCDHEFGGYCVTKEPTCLVEGKEESTCLLCGRLSTRAINPLGHKFVNAKCERCGVKDESHVHTSYRVVVLNENKHLYLCSCGEPYSAAQEHFWEEQSYVSSVANHLPYKSSVICSDCGFSRDFYKVNDVLNIHTLQKGETISISDLSSYDCLYYSSVGACEISVTASSGSVAKITFPSLKKGEKLLVDAKTGFYSIWSDAVSEEKILVDSKYVTDNGGYYYQFAPIVESVPNPLDRVNAYFESVHLDRYDYPDNDKSKVGTGFNRPYPGTGRGSANNIMLISFPFETLQDIKNSLDEYPLYLILYDGTKVAIKSVTSTSDPFIASYVALKGSNGGINGGHITGGDSYAQGYADAYNTLTNAVIADNPIQGFMQGMWYGVLAMVTILGNGISIGGISLFSVLVTVLIICAAYLLLKVIRK